MQHTNEIAIKILTDEYGDYPRNAWHYDSEYNMLVKAYNQSYKNGFDSGMDLLKSAINTIYKTLGI